MNVATAEKDQLTSSPSLTIQTTEARIFSSFGWGFSKNIESHGLSRFKANVQRVRHFLPVKWNVVFIDVMSVERGCFTYSQYASSSTATNHWNGSWSRWWLSGTTIVGRNAKISAREKYDAWTTSPDQKRRSSL